MAYTDGQIDRLRARLCAYRAQMGENGRMRPWKAVIDDILMSEATAHEYPANGALPEFKEEALRRFAAGTSVPSQDKLEDIHAFLVDERFLTDEALNEGVWDYAVALSLRSLFGEVAGSGEFCQSVSGAYRSETEAEHKGLKGFARYDMSVEAVEGEAMLRLGQRWFTWVYDTIPDAELEKRYSDQIRSQSGFGFPAEGGELTLFFKDGFTGRTDILFVTDMMAGGGNPVDWFQAAKVNSGVNFSDKLPEEAADTYRLDKVLYRSHRLIEAEKAGG